MKNIKVFDISFIIISTGFIILINVFGYANLLSQFAVIFALIAYFIGKYIGKLELKQKLKEEKS